MWYLFAAVRAEFLVRYAKRGRFVSSEICFNRKRAVGSFFPSSAWLIDCSGIRCSIRFFSIRPMKKSAFIASFMLVPVVDKKGASTSITHLQQIWMHFVTRHTEKANNEKRGISQNAKTVVVKKTMCLKKNGVC
jgi:hypothetical protein